MDFAAIDVETANADPGSICQVGIAVFRAGALAAEWKTLIDPESWFDAGNVAVHGIRPADVAGAPRFPEVAHLIRGHLAGGGGVVVSHSPFDRTALARACTRHGLPGVEATWLDTVRVARRAWNEGVPGGYGLRSLCDLIGHRFGHHDALEDARAAGLVLLAASARAGLDVAGWLARVEQPVAGPVPRAGNPDGPFFGEVLVFAGALVTPRAHAATLATRLGYAVSESVSGRTTLVVVSDRGLFTATKSSKHRKAEERLARGQRIRIVGETEFLRLAR